MKSKRNGCLAAIVVVVLFCLLINRLIRNDDAETRYKRERVNELVSVGQNLDDAQDILRNAGFRLYYDEPVMPSISKDYYQQLVVVGSTQPNIFESIGYAAEFSWIPFIHRESPYVIINSDLSKVIREID